MLLNLLDGINHLRFPGTDLVFVPNQAVNESAANLVSRRKLMLTNALPLKHLRPGLKNGFFTVRLLPPPLAHKDTPLTLTFIENLSTRTRTKSLATHLVLKWALGGLSTNINDTEDFTCMALDTIGLCSMGSRLRQLLFIRDESPWLTFSLRPVTEGQGHCQACFTTLRLRNPTKIMKNAFYYSRGIKCPEERSTISDDSIISDLMTFLVAGHETTSRILSDTFYHLPKNPETFAKTQQEVDPVRGKGPVTLAHISKLGYINGALREALRIDSTIPTIGLSRKEDTTLGGKYCHCSIEIQPSAAKVPMISSRSGSRKRTSTISKDSFPTTGSHLAIANDRVSVGLVSGKSV
ncbi:unnamed protein product [Clonostachys rhizophaga]|uniref:Cytochrome P450 n=1 Tax=Clonostachys rhizophaga TaxID=160324 RepID=A0A9N9VGA8_9HYPO|nr:unnamed protein product [Clonostachys rhizophaga]